MRFLVYYILLLTFALPGMNTDFSEMGIKQFRVYHYFKHHTYGGEDLDIFPLDNETDEPIFCF